MASSGATTQHLTPQHAAESFLGGEGQLVRQETMLGLIVRRFLRHRLAAAGLLVLVAIGLSALLAPAITQDPNALAALDRKQGPSAAHLLGTDEAGRDIFAR